MASRRALLVLPLRGPACSIARPCIPAPWRAIGAPAPRAAAVGCGSVLQQGRQGRQMRWHSSEVPKSKVYEFDDVSARRRDVGAGVEEGGRIGLTVLDAGEEDRGESG